MAFTEMTDDLDIIAKYPDEPYEEEGFTSTAFKASFDQGAKLCKAAINRLVQALNSGTSAGSLGFKPTASIPESTVQGAVEYTQETLGAAVTNLRTYLLGQMQEMTQGSVSDGSINEQKLDSDAVTEPKIKDGSVTEPKIGTEAVTEPKIKDGSVTELKIADSAVTNTKIAPGALLQDVTSDVAITCTSGHGFESHLKFLYSRALGVVFVNGYVVITPWKYDFDINAVCSFSDYMPNGVAPILCTSPYADVGFVSATVGAAGISFSSDYSDQYASRRVNLSGFYLCDGSGTEA